MAYGDIKEPVPQMVRATQGVASNIAASVIPTQNDIFSQLAESPHIQVMGDPRKSMNIPLAYSGQRISETPAMSLSALQNQLNQPTRRESANISGVALPNLKTPPRRGVATSAQQVRMPQGGGGGQQQEESSNNPLMVDEKYFNKSLAQTLGSGMLSAEQIRSASFANVQAMIGFRDSAPTPGGGSTGLSLSSQDKQEMTFYMQRMILEGYVRGVDLTKAIKATRGGKMTFGFGDGFGLKGGNGAIGLGGTNAGVALDRSFWSKANDAEKLGLFYQEVGHALLDFPSGVQGHSRGLMKGADADVQNGGGSLKSNYDKYLNWFFEDANSGAGKRFNPTKGLSNNEVQSLLSTNPDWVPSVSGGPIPKSDHVNGVKTNPGGNAGSDNFTNNNSYTMVPQTVELAQNVGTLTGTGGGQKQAMPAMASSVAPQGLDSNVLTPTKSFAAGMADLSKQGPDMAKAGALLKSG